MAERRRREEAARVSAAVCAECETAIPPGAPVWMRWGSCPTCGVCATAHWWWDSWRRCESCGRMLYYPRPWRANTRGYREGGWVRLHTYCSDACHRLVRKARLHVT